MFIFDGENSIRIHPLSPIDYNRTYAHVAHLGLRRRGLSPGYRHIAPLGLNTPMHSILASRSFFPYIYDTISTVRNAHLEKNPKCPLDVPLSA